MILSPSWFLIAISRHAARVVGGAGGECMCGERPSVGGHHWSSAIRRAMHVLCDRINTDRISVVCSNHRILFFFSLSPVIYILQKNSRYIFLYWIEPYRMEFITLFSHYITGSIVSRFISQNSIPDFFPRFSSKIPGWKYRRYSNISADNIFLTSKWFCVEPDFVYNKLRYAGNESKSLNWHPPLILTPLISLISSVLLYSIIEFRHW